MLSEPYTDFFRGAFQIGFVTTDIEHAVKLFRDRYGVNFLRIPIQTKVHFYGAAETSDLVIECALANVGSTQFELIEPAPGTPVYSDILPDSGFAVRPHHHAFLVPGGASGWSEFRKAIKSQGRVVALESLPGNHLDFLYLDEREYCGQFCEYVSDTANFHKAFLRPPAN